MVLKYGWSIKQTIIDRILYRLTSRTRWHLEEPKSGKYDIKIWPWKLIYTWPKDIGYIRHRPNKWKEYWGSYDSHGY